MTSILDAEIPLEPIIDTENPLYCPAEPAAKYLKSITSNGFKIRKPNKFEKTTMRKKGRRQTKVTVSSFVKMLAQVAIVMQKEKEGRKKEEKMDLPLSQSDCHDYGTPPLPARRPVRKTRKDRAAQYLLKFPSDSPVDHQELSPDLRSISISLPEIPDDLLPVSPTSTISLPNSTFTDISSESNTTKIVSPLLPPGLGHQDKSEPQYLSKSQHGPATQAEQPTAATTEERKRQKRSLEEAFPELLKKPAKFARSFTCDPQPKPEPSVDQESGENPDLCRSVELELEILKDIDRGKKLNHKIGNSPDAVARKQNGGCNDNTETTENESAEVRRRLRELEESLYGPVIGTETPRGYEKLVQRLDGMMPGIRLGNRLAKFKHLDSEKLYLNSATMQSVKDGPHQAAADLLAAEGLLNERIINVFRTSEITRLDLGPSLSEEGGLNLGGRAVWDVFTRSNGFLFLSELSFNNTSVMDGDLVKLVGLPKLAVLKLINTGISDEGVFHLTALKLTLTHLYLSHNPCITNDAVPALNLCITSKLRHLGLVGTSIAMTGLRRMARLIQREERVIDVEIPDACELYIDDIPNFYLLHPKPPLITSPGLCSNLSAAALQRNLEAHAEVANNAPVSSMKTAPMRIFTGGTKEEMCERLRELLIRREVDLVVWGMIYGYGEGDVGNRSAKDETMKYLEAQAAARDARKTFR